MHMMLEGSLGSSDEDVRYTSFVDNPMDNHHESSSDRFPAVGSDNHTRLVVHLPLAHDLLQL